MKVVKITVDCPIYHRKIDNYCYVLNTDNDMVIKANGCDQFGGSLLCQKCLKHTRDTAEKMEKES